MEEQQQNLDRAVMVGVGARHQVASVEAEVRQRMVVEAEGEDHLRVAVEVEEGQILLEH